MSRKVFVEVKARLVIDADEGVEISDVISEMKFVSQIDEADIVDSEILNHEVTDSK